MAAAQDNQILKFHRARERCYDLTKLRTGSVRDQLLRAVTLTRSLIEVSKEICESKPGVLPRDLLVLGGGVAGVACALVAARMGVKVTLLEVHPTQLFATLHKSSRRIAPFEYDWPRRGDPLWIFSARERSLLLRYRSGNARWVCAEWHVRMAEWRRRSKDANNVDVIYGADALRCYTIEQADSANGTILAKGNFPGDCVEKEFGAVVDCTGHVRERTFIEDADKKTGRPPPHVFCGPRFWFDRDFLHHRRKFFIPPGADPVEGILVSGGGDGAMQDFQRIVTGHFGEKLLQKFICHLGLGDLREHFYELAEADDAAKRAYAWKLSDGELEEMKTCDETFARIAKEVLKKYAAKNNASIGPNWPHHLARRVFKPMMCQGNTPRIVWAVEQSACNYAYGLNRFLAHLTVQLLEELMGQEVLRFKTKIKKIVSAVPSHQCCSDSVKCFGYRHTVSFEGATKPEDFNIIVIRHGLIFPETAVFGAKAPFPEQIVPYDMPR